MFDISSGKSQLFLPPEKEVIRLGWSKGERGIFVLSNSQIGIVFGKGKEFQPITRDANSYDSLTASEDGRRLAAIETRTSNSLTFLDSSSGQASHTIPLSRTNAFVDFNWTVDGNLLFNDGSRLWKLGPDGKNESLLGDGTSQIFGAEACGARNIVYTSNISEGTNIWRAQADGLGAVRLTSGGRVGWPVCSPDQKWVYYFQASDTDQPLSLSRVRLDGSGKPEMVPGSVPPGLSLDFAPISISPDGETLAYILLDTRPRASADNRPDSSRHTLALLSLRSTNPPRQLDLNPHFAEGVAFTPDGKAVACRIRENGVENIWAQPVDGSPGHQITSFASDHIGEFHWSPDGKSLGVIRSHSESDVVLLQESKP
jgi:hypothetical protein